MRFDTSGTLAGSVSSDVGSSTSRASIVPVSPSAWQTSSSRVRLAPA